MLLKFIKSFVLAFLIFVIYIFLFYTSEDTAPREDLNKNIESQLASYEEKIRDLSDKEMEYNNLMQSIKSLQSDKDAKIGALITDVEFTSILRNMSSIAKRYNLSISTFDVKPMDNDFFQEYDFTVKFRGPYLKIVELFGDQNFLPKNAKLKRFSIVGPVSNSKFVLTETSLQFSLFREKEGGK